MSENRAKVVVGGLYREHHIHDAAAMQMPGQIEEVHGAGGGEGGALMGGDAQVGQSYRGEQEHGMLQDGGGDAVEENQDGSMEREGVDDMPLDASNLGMIPAPAMGNQLTLSFQGEVYVFDSVSAEKVAALSRASFSAVESDSYWDDCLGLT